MDSIESNETESKNYEDSILKLIQSSVKKTSSKMGYKNAVSNTSGYGGYVAGTIGGDFENDILFNRDMPKSIHWSVSWADIMMTMFILFAVLYILRPATKVKIVTQQEVTTEYVEEIKNVPHDTEGNPQTKDKQSIQDVYDMSRQTLNAATSVELVPDKAVRIILKSDLLFDLGKADIKEEAKTSLREVAEVLGQTSYMVNVVGHTDDLPINTEEFPSNWELSTARACKVAGFLMEEMKIPEGKFYISGYASYQPVKPNTNEMNRAANRRVEIIITKERPYGLEPDIM